MNDYAHKHFITQASGEIFGAELCFLSVVERFHEWWGELVPTTAALIQDLWSLWITLNIIDTITCPLGLH